MEKTAASLYNPNKIDFTQEPMICGLGKNTQRFDSMKYPFFDSNNDKQQGFDWKHNEIPLKKDSGEFRTVCTDAQRWIVTKNKQKLIFLDSLQGRGPFLIIGQLTTLPELENVALTWNYFEGCLTPDTEVLTSNGWKLIGEVGLNDKVLSCNEDGIGSFEHPTKLHTYKSDGYINMFRGKHISQNVTDQHRMLLEDRKGNRLTKRVQNIKITNRKSNYNLVNAITKTNNTVISKPFTDFDKFMVALQADGTIQKEYTRENGEIVYKNRNGKKGYIRVTFTFSKERKIERMKSILDSLNYEYTVRHTKRNQKMFYIKVPMGLNISKNFEDWIKYEDISSPWAKSFILELSKWDGWDYKNPTIGYDTTSESNARYAEIIGVIGGFKTSCTIVEPRKENHKEVYRLSFNTKVKTSSRTAVTVDRVPYDGNVHCLTVPGGFFTIRHNGKISITGNCKHSKTYTEILRALYDEPDKVFDESFEIPELMELADKISAPYERVYYNTINYVYKTQRGLEITKEETKELYKSFIMWVIEVNALEGIRFYTGFAATWGITESQKILNGVTDDLKLICRDENQHLALTQMMIKLIKTDRSNLMVDLYKSMEKEIFDRYIEIYNEEIKWAKFMFKEGSYIGMNEDIIIQYLNYITIRRMKTIGLHPTKEDLGGLYQSSNPLPWINTYINMDLEEKKPQSQKILNYITGGVDNDLEDFDDLEDLL